jgi:putative endopeptidase
MKIRHLVIPVVLSAMTLHSNAQTSTTVAPAKTTTKSKTTVTKTAPTTKTTPATRPTSANSAALIKPVSASSVSKDPAIKQLDFSTKIKPTEDFFEYVNQRWTKANPIPADKSRFGMFDKLDERSRLVVKRILENSANLKIKAPKGSNLQILGDFYRNAMDTAAIDKSGVQPLQGWFTEIENATTPSALTKIFSKLGMRDMSSPLGYYVDVDAKNTTRYVMYIGQGGLGLPDKDFYFRKDEKSLKNLDAYGEYIKNLFQLSGLDKKVTAKQHMQNVLEIENLLAAASMSRVELRDPEKNYNLFTIDKLKADYKNIDWDAFFGEMKVTPKEIVVGQPAFYKTVDSMFANIPHEKWVSYIEFHLLNGTAKHLNKEIVNARFDFFGKTLSGIVQLEPRWKRISYVSEQYLRDLIGQEYVKTNFSPKAKKRALDLVENIRAALKERLNELTWMGAETKAKALEKLAKIDVKIGYPDKWWTYENTDVSNQPHVLNVLNCAYAENLRILARLNKEKIDRTEWGMGPQTVNAYYNPLINEIVFPAAILQPPFFYENADDAVNYGGIGMVIGHEITHGFDDQGSQFDAEGNLKNWWTETDKKSYEALTDKFVKQYNQYKPFPGDSLHVNGELTLGENIADLGGMIISLNALKKANGTKTTPLISGLTPEQRFFINYAIIWRESMRPEAMRMQILSNEHSPAKYRVNGVLSNLPEFHKAFNVKPTDPMYIKEADRAKMW